MMSECVQCLCIVALVVEVCDASLRILHESDARRFLNMKCGPILRQVIVVTGLAFCSLSDGFIFGQMSGMLDALKGKDETITLNDDEISWIASTINITCFCGFGLMCILTEIFGRRKSIIIISTPVLICWIVVYLAQDKNILLMTRIIVGASYGGILILSYMNIGEYISPGSRSLCLNLMVACGSFGTLLGHILSLFLHWRHVALVGLIPTTISIIMPLFWIESPFWLATKGRFVECESAFKAIRNINKTTDLELRNLINSQKIISKKSNVILSHLYKYKKACQEIFYRRISLLLVVISIYRVAAGKILLNTLMITMLQDITGSSDILLYTLLVDGLTLVGGCLSCIFVSRLRMRTLLFTSGPIANIIQIALAVCLFLFPENTVYIRWTKVSLLASYSVIINVGPYAVLETLLSELHPLNIKAMSTFILGAIAGIIQFLGIKLAPKLFTVIGYHGVFFCNAIIVFICLVYLYFYLPETKGRTLQEIQFYFVDNRYIEYKDMPSSEHQLVLLSKHTEQIEKCKCTNNTS